jgi:hypothetical protein
VRRGVGFSLEHSIKRRAADVESFGRAKFVPAAGEENVASVLLKHIIQEHQANLAAFRSGDGLQIEGVEQALAACSIKLLAAECN